MAVTLVGGRDVTTSPIQRPPHLGALLDLAGDRLPGVMATPDT